MLRDQKQVCKHVFQGSDFLYIFSNKFIECHRPTAICKDSPELDSLTNQQFDFTQPFFHKDNQFIVALHSVICV